MLKLNNKLEYVYKQGRYTFAFAHYQVSFGNLRGRRLSTRKKGVASNEVQPAQAQPSPRLAKNSPLDCFCPALQGRSLRGRPSPPL